MLLTETPMPGQRAEERGVAEGEDPAVLADQEVAPTARGGHDAHDVVHVDVHGRAGSRRSRRDWPTGNTKTPPSEPTRS